CRVIARNGMAPQMTTTPATARPWCGSRNQSWWIMLKPSLDSSQLMTLKSGSVSQPKSWIDTICGTDQTNISTVVRRILAHRDEWFSISATSIASTTDATTTSTVKTTVRTVIVQNRPSEKTSLKFFKPAQVGPTSRNRLCADFSWNDMMIILTNG